MSNTTIEIKLNELLHKKHMSLTKLSVLTGIEVARLSELANNKRQRIHLEHICKISDVLEISEISEILEIKKVDKS
ncbi:helix-turn-helix domain-containing protein [Listeria ilorinensis]|uniref:helix-turn-helix domain-containing protein n=1 Tax=Listeria ilorinensis TaxID=2867439 RepID=UPI001EF50319|nr:helix-turn-helix transcriptional regulator [Listeria ilorinensis]